MRLVFHHSKLQSIALEMNIEVSVEQLIHSFQHYKVSILYNVGWSWRLGIWPKWIHFWFPMPIFHHHQKQGLLLTPLWILQSSKFNVQSLDNLASKTLSDLKHNGGQTHFTCEIWQHSAAIDWLPLVQTTTQLVWMSTQELIQQYCNIILVVSGLSFQDSWSLTSIT